MVTAGLLDLRCIACKGRFYRSKDMEYLHDGSNAVCFDCFVTEKFTKGNQARVFAHGLERIAFKPHAEDRPERAEWAALIASDFWLVGLASGDMIEVPRLMFRAAVQARYPEIGGI
jgi:hypothetical protein